MNLVFGWLTQWCWCLYVRISSLSSQFFFSWGFFISFKKKLYHWGKWHDARVVNVIYCNYNWFFLREFKSQPYCVKFYFLEVPLFISYERICTFGKMRRRPSVCASIVFCFCWIESHSRRFGFSVERICLTSLKLLLRVTNYHDEWVVNCIYWFYVSFPPHEI